MERPLVQIRGLSLRLGDFAVHEADLDIVDGDYFVLLGPTGAGKTVLLECVAGLYQPEEGDVYVNGERVNDIAPERRGLGYLPQDYALFPHLSVAQNIAFGMRLRKKSRTEIEAKVQELASLLGITHLLARDTTTLSGGERQRTALARALAIEPKVLLLDEPLSALDEQTREGLCVELRRVHEELGTTTLHVSHNFEETLAVADRIGIIHEGRVRQVGTPEEVFRRPNSEFVARFVRTENIYRGRAHQGEEGLRVMVENVALRAAAGPGGDVYLSVRPEDVVVDHGSTEQANRMVGRVARIVDKGALMRVDVQGDLLVTALLGRRSFAHMGLQVGDQATVSFDPSMVHVFAAE